MKRILFLILITFAASTHAKNVKLYLKMSFKNEEDMKRIPRVKITVKDLETEELVKQLKSDANGNITKVTVPIQKLYWIQVESEGWCTKTFYLDTRWEKVEDLPSIITFILDEKLFKVTDEKAYSFMEEEPMREFLFTETGGFTWKKEEGIRADKKLKLVRLNNVPHDKADKYLDLMEQVEAAEKSGDKAGALKLLEKAKKLHPSTEVDEAIKRIGG